MLDFELSPEQIELRKRVRDFAQREILPLAWHYDERDDIPLSVLHKAFDQGIMNSGIPKQYGGQGLGHIESALLTEEIAAACPGLATSIFDNALGLEPIVLCNNEPLKERYLSEIAAHFKLISFATSEPTMGSDVASLRCLARREGEDYLLNGTKYWITNAGIADYMTVFATTDPKRKHAGICAFLVHRDWEGVSVGRKIPKLGQRTSNTAAWNFKYVRVPKENVVAEPGQGFVLAMQTFARTRPIIGAFALGAARSAMEYAIDYAKRRKAFGSSLADFQAIQHKIAEMYQKVETARLLVWKSAWEADRGRDPTAAASMAKFYATEAAMAVVDEALQIFGGYGYTRLYPIEKLYRDTRLFKIYEGTSEIQRMIVADHALNRYQAAMPPLDEIPVIRQADISSENGKHQKMWRCRICGHVHAGDMPPEECPYCFFSESAFTAVN